MDPSAGIVKVWPNGGSHLSRGPKMKVELVDVENLIQWDDGELLDKEAAELMKASVLRAIAMGCEKATIYVTPRNPVYWEPNRHPGWLEFLMRVEFEEGTFMTLGCLQRRPGEEFEWHS